MSLEKIAFRGVGMRTASPEGKNLILPKAGGGDGGIRTLGTLIEYGSLAGNWFQPLTHVSGQQQGCKVRAIIAMFASGKVA